MGYPGQTDINSVEFHPQPVLTGIQWLVCWWMLVHSGQECNLMAAFKT